MASSHPFQHILVWVDGTDAADNACQKAIELASAARARITAVAVVDTETLSSLLKQKFLVPDEMQDFEREIEASSEKYLNKARECAKKAGVKTDVVLLRGTCHSAVLAEIKKSGADLVVMGIFSAEDIRRDLTARERQLLLDNSPVPVLVVP